jgi:hypothetical protein
VLQDTAVDLATLLTIRQIKKLEIQNFSFHGTGRSVCVLSLSMTARQPLLHITFTSALFLHLQQVFNDVNVSIIIHIDLLGVCTS